MVFNALQINSYVFGEECKGKKICSVDERWHQRSANSASLTSPSHWPSSGDVWVRACNVWLPQGPSYSMNVVVRIGNKAFQTSRLSPNSHLFPNRATTAKRRPAVLSIVRKVWMVRSTGAGAVNFLKESFANEETCRDRYHIDHAGRWLVQRVAILADQPLCSDELGDQLSSLLCRLIR